MTTLQARSCPTCRSIGPRRIVAGSSTTDVLCPDAWHAHCGCGCGGAYVTGQCRACGAPEPQYESRRRDDAVTKQTIADQAYRIRALESVLADRERELLYLKGPCSTTGCPLHYAHSGPCAPAPITPDTGEATK